MPDQLLVFPCRGGRAVKVDRIFTTILKELERRTNHVPNPLAALAAGGSVAHTTVTGIG